MHSGDVVLICGAIPHGDGIRGAALGRQLAAAPGFLVHAECDNPMRVTLGGVNCKYQHETIVGWVKVLQ